MQHARLDRSLERLYARLVRLDTAPALDPALGEVLRLLAEVACCELVYIELAASEATPAYSIGYATHALPGGVRARVPRGLLAQASAAGATIEASVPDAEKRWRESAVALIAPIGAVVSVGVLYAESAASFAPNEREHLETVAHALAGLWPVAPHGARTSLVDELTILKARRIRAAMERHRGNIAAVARELGVSRTLVYRAVDVAPRDTIAGHLSTDESFAPDMSRDATQIVRKPASDLDNVIAIRKRTC